MKSLILAILMMPAIASAFEYDVDMPNSGDPKIQLIRITIDSCQTKFKVKKADFEKFSENPAALTKLVKLAIENANSGCNN